MGGGCCIKTFWKGSCINFFGRGSCIKTFWKEVVHLMLEGGQEQPLLLAVKLQPSSKKRPSQPFSICLCQEILFFELSNRNRLRNSNLTMRGVSLSLKNWTRKPIHVPVTVGLHNFSLLTIALYLSILLDRFLCT